MATRGRIVEGGRWDRVALVVLLVRLVRERWRQVPRLGGRIVAGMSSMRATWPILSRVLPKRETAELKEK